MGATVTPGTPTVTGVLPDIGPGDPFYDAFLKRWRRPPTSGEIDYESRRRVFAQYTGLPTISLPAELREPILRSQPSPAAKAVYGEAESGAPQTGKEFLSQLSEGVGQGVKGVAEFAATPLRLLEAGTRKIMGPPRSERGNATPGAAPTEAPTPGQVLSGLNPYIQAKALLSQPNIVKVLGQVQGMALAGEAAGLPGAALERAVGPRVPVLPSHLTPEKLMQTKTTIATHVATNGGVTFDPLTGNNLSKGYAVGDPATTRPYTGTADIDALLADHLDAFQDPNAKIGVWHDPQTGQGEIEISHVFEDKGQALQEAINRKQQFVGDLEKYAKGEDGNIPVPQAEPAEARLETPPLAESGAAPGNMDRQAAAAGQKMLETERRKEQVPVPEERRAAPENIPEGVPLRDHLAKVEQDALGRVQQRSQGRLTAGLDPEDVKDLTIATAARIGLGTVDFAHWSAEMTQQYGPEVAPHLPKVWKAAGAQYQRIVQAATRRGQEMPQAQQLVQLFKEGSGSQAFYNDQNVKFDELFGDKKDADTFLKFFAITSADRSLPSNVDLAVKAFVDWKMLGRAPRMSEGYTGWQATAFSKALKGERWTGPDYFKTHDFYDALRGDPNAVVNDTWIGRIWFGKDFSGKFTPGQYKFIANTIRELAKKHGVTPREFQAGLWGGIKRFYEGDQEIGAPHQLVLEHLGQGWFDELLDSPHAPEALKRAKANIDATLEREAIADEEWASKETAKIPPTLYEQTQGWLKEHPDLKIVGPAIRLEGKVFDGKFPEHHVHPLMRAQEFYRNPNVLKQFDSYYQVLSKADANDAEGFVLNHPVMYNGEITHYLPRQPAYALAEWNGQLIRGRIERHRAQAGELHAGDIRGISRTDLIVPLALVGTTTLTGALLDKEDRARGALIGFLAPLGAIASVKALKAAIEHLPKETTRPGEPELPAPQAPGEPIEPRGALPPLPAPGRPVGAAGIEPTDLFNVERTVPTPPFEEGAPPPPEQPLGPHAALEEGVQNVGARLYGPEGERPVRHFAEAEAKAQQLATEPEKLLKTPASRMTGEERLALRILIRQGVERKTDLAKALMDPDLPDADRAQLESEHVRLTQETERYIAHAMRGGTQQGRDLAFNRIIAADHMDPVTWYQRAKDLLGERPLTDEMRAKIDDFIGKHDTAGLAQYVAGLRRATTIEKAILFFKVNLISALTTAVRIPVSNAVQQAFNFATKPIGVMTDRLVGGLTGVRTTTFLGWNLHDYARAASDQMVRDMKDIVAGRQPAIGPRGGGAGAFQTREVNYENPITGDIANFYTKSVLRLHGLEHRLQWAPAYQRTLFELARGQGIKQGLSGKALAEFAKERAANPTAEHQMIAIEAANEATFLAQGRITKLLRDAQRDLLSRSENAPSIEERVKARALLATLTVATPFPAISTNIVGRSLSMTPAGVFPVGLSAIEVYRQFRAKDTEALTSAQAKLVRRVQYTVGGTAAGFLTGIYLYHSGHLSPSMPEGQGAGQKKAVMKAKGQPPNSFSFSMKPGSWHNIFALGPLGLSMSFGANFAHALEENPDASDFEQLALAVGAAGKAATEETFLKGASDVVQAIASPLQEGPRIAKGLAGDVVPNFVAKLAKATDEYQRDPKTLIQTLESRVPGLSHTVPPKRGPFFEPVPETRGGAEIMADPFYSGTAEASKDPLVAEIARVGYIPPAVQRYKDEKDEEFNRRAALVGQVTKQAVQTLVDSRGYQTIPEIATNAWKDHHDLIKPIAVMLGWPKVPENADELALALQGAFLRKVVGLARAPLAKAGGVLEKKRKLEAP